jgi:hypothetical protein
MTYRPSAGDPLRGPADVSYSGVLLRIFTAGAVGVALLPLPVTLLKLLPTYPAHAPVLAFLAPLVCLLSLAYLFYVRDSLARVMFAHLLHPMPGHSRYPERSELRIRRFVVSARRHLLAFLPAILLLGSFACMANYVVGFKESLVLAPVRIDQGDGPEDVGLVPSKRGRDRARTLDSVTPDQSPTRAGHDAGRVDTIQADGLSPNKSPWQQVLGALSLTDIPNVMELTALYVGAFLTAVLALALMGFREYAKDALGLSERDVVLGRVLEDPD